MPNMNNSHKTVCNFLCTLENNWRSRRNIIIAGALSSKCSHTIQEKIYHNNDKFIIENIDAFIKALHRVLSGNSISSEIIGRIPLSSFDKFKDYFIENPDECLNVLANRNDSNWEDKDQREYLDYFTLQLIRHYDAILLWGVK